MSRSSTRPAAAGLLVGLAAAAMLAGCGRSSESSVATQVAVRVNERDITVHQINQQLAQSRQLGPEQVQAASREVLERLIDQELALQQALDQKVDREPTVVAAIEAARRDVIARAYIERIIGGVGAPNATEVQAYYQAHPELFAERQIYTLVQMDVALPEARLPELQAKAQEGKGVEAVASWAASQSLAHASTQSTQAAETLPLDLVPQLAALPAGHGAVQAANGGAHVWFVTARQSSPVALDQARPVIEQALVNEHKRLAALAEVKRLRGTAKLEYQGPFAGAGPVKTVAQAEPAAAAASGTALDDGQLKKGLGLP